MKNISCAVLGLGRLGEWHAANLATKISGAELGCIADPNKERVERAANLYNVPKYTTDANDVLVDPNVNAVIIATPTVTHATLIKKAVQNGKHIFVEKPLTETVAEADDVINTLDQTDVVCQVGFMRRFDPAYMEAKQKITKGDIGQPIYFKSISRDPVSPPERFIKNSGGIFIDMAIHDYDAARFLMDTEVVTVSAHGSVLKNAFMRKYNDADQALTYLTFESGATGDIESSRNAFYGYDIRCEVIGTEGTIMIGSGKQHDLTLLSVQGEVREIVPDFAQRFKDAYVLEMAHFITCLRNNERPSVNVRDGRIALKIAEAAKKSYEQQKQIPLK